MTEVPPFEPTSSKGSTDPFTPLSSAMLKQREKEMVEDIERKRKTNEQSLTSQLEEVSLELTNMQSVLSLEQSCFM